MADPSIYHARNIRKEAARLGFSAIGFSSPLPQLLAMQRYNAMIAEHRHAEMTYMEQRTDERRMPSMLLPGLKTIISAAISYNLPLHNSSGKPNISQYALIGDYHMIIRKKLEELLIFLKNLMGDDLNATITIDSSPVLEKTWAEHSGIGKTGKNTLLIVPSAGSYVFLGEIFINKEITDNKPPIPNLCGSCSNCLENCPTGALIEPGKLDASRCISYLTVELKRDFTAEESAMIGNQLFGCDRCQECCPHNQHTSITADKSFTLRNDLLNISTETILNLTTSSFRNLFYGTPVFRIGLKRLKRNARAVHENLNRAE
jgi:epoxyqueuosine reductase